MGDAAEKEAPPASAGAGKVALVLEDSDPNRRIVVTILEKMGFDVYDAINGRNGLEKLNEIFEAGKKLELIMSDVMMPEMDGFQFLEKVRTKNELDGVPFIFVTALANKEDIQRAQSMNASGYILKPIVADQMIKKLISLFPDLEKTGKEMINSSK